MTITEVLQFVDRLVEKETGEHLDDLQKEIIQGLWQGKTYKEISENIPNGYNENYIGDVSRQLFKTLSKQLGDEVNKYNFCWTIERVINSPQSLVGLFNGNINYCPYRDRADPQEAIASPGTTHPTNKYQNLKYHDLTLAPKIRQFGDRTSELNTLSQWLCDDPPQPPFLRGEFDRNTPLISVLGIAGIGKTALVKRFLDLHLEAFDIVVWKNLKLSPSLNAAIAQLFRGINRETDATDHPLTQLLNLFREQRCLIILDNLQEIFIPGQFAGQYQNQHKDYKKFFNLLTEISHQSTVIVISQEQSPEMLSLDEELYPTKCLELQGLANPKILKPFGLTDPESWVALMQRYQGHPVYLKEIAHLIKKVFQGKVSEFLTENSLILTEEMNAQLSELFHRLSPVEQQIALELSQAETSISREQLSTALSLSSTELIQGLDSLQRRYILQCREMETILFNLAPIFRAYLQISRDISGDNR
jgi:hypothetical protein